METLAVTRPARPRRRSVPEALWYLCLVPFAGLVVGIRSWAWVPAGDYAVSRVEILQPGWPLLGAYSQWGFRHPGPAFGWVLEAATALWDDPRAMAMGAVALSAGLAALAVGAGRQGAGTSGAALGSIAVLVVFAGYGAQVVASPWNPHVALFGVPALTLSAFAALRGRLLGLVAAPVVATVLLQSHVGLAAIGAWYVLVAASGLLWHRAAWRWLVIGLGASLVLWAAPLWEQVTADGDGNLTAIARFLAGEDAPPRTGLRAGAGDLVRTLSPAADWLPFSSSAETGMMTKLPVLALPVVVAVVLAVAEAWSRRSGTVSGTVSGYVSERPLHALLLVQVPVGPIALVALSSVRGPRFPHLAIWAHAWAALLVVTACGVVAVQVAERLGSTAWLRYTAAGAVALLAVPLTLSAVRVDPPAGLPVEDAVLHQAIAARSGGDRPVVLTKSGIGEDGGFTILVALVAEAVAAGEEVLVTRDLEAVFPERYVADDPIGPHRCLVVHGGPPLTGADAEGLALVASFGTHLLYERPGGCARG